MSLLLFVLVMDYLSRMLKQDSLGSRFKFHPPCARIKVTHLAFADDLILFSVVKEEAKLVRIKAFHRFFPLLARLPIRVSLKWLLDI